MGEEGRKGNKNEGNLEGNHSKLCCLLVPLILFQ